jgi:flavin reductase (DIM6/NTAB) family NADH-FMN oxidoreductase RutF
VGRMITAGVEHSASRPLDDRSTAFLRAFRGHPAGVTIVTLPSPVGPVGFTATSVTSLSFDPPMLSFGVSTRSSCWPAVRDGTTFVVNFLGAHQFLTAQQFSLAGIDRFAPPVRWHSLSTGEPVLDDPCAWLRCIIEARIPTGSHCLVIASVALGEVTARGEPLIYHDGRYRVAGEELLTRSRPGPGTSVPPTTLRPLADGETEDQR